MSRPSILVIEDNIVNLELAQMFLKKHGYDVLCAMDANEALTILKDQRPKIILMDLQLPGIDGLQLTKLLKSNPQTKDIYIIALTAYTSKIDEEKARLAGCDAFITKPFDTRALPQLIEHFLESAQS